MPSALTHTTLREYAASRGDDRPAVAFQRLHELSREIFPASSPDGLYGYAVSVLFLALEDYRDGIQIMPENLENDQVEDYLVGYIVGRALDYEYQGRFDG
jgi:hypothetical protein